MKFHKVALAFLALPLILANSAEPRAPLVRVSSGMLEGVSNDGIEVYRGVPFATAPTGALRWKPPVPAVPWSGIRAATASAPACYQAQPASFGPYTSEFLIDGNVSEDCLYLNIWAPPHGSGRIPVLVFIHGGGFNSGSGTVPIYDGSTLAKQGIVVVTINYRLGVFGFLATPELTKESAGVGTGNFGLLDQIAALRWVNANITAFGGDPKKVTIAGQSAGAASVNALIMSPLAKGLFHRAIAQSGSGMGVESPDLAEAERFGLEFQRKFGAVSIDELRRVTAEALSQAAQSPPPPAGTLQMPRLRFVPVKDGNVLPSDPSNGSNPIASNVPLLTGYNSDEGFPAPTQNVAEAFVAMVEARYGAFAGRFLALYPHATDEQAAIAWREISRDRYMASLVFWSQARASAAGQKIFGYLYTHPYPALPGRDSFGAFHTSEIPLIFGTYGLGGRSQSQIDARTSAFMSSLWVRFVKGQALLGAGHAWPVITPNRSTVMELGSRATMQSPASSRERLEAFADYARAGGRLSLF